MSGSNVATPEKGATALIQKVWEVLWDMWDHYNKVRLNTLMSVKQCHIIGQNALVENKYTQGTVALCAKDQHWLVNPPVIFLLQYDYAGKEQ
jgi:hypothetical protein